MPIQELIAKGYTQEEAVNMYINWEAVDTNEFSVEGYFYNLGELKFRRFLEIKRLNDDTKENDLNVIMMFPGKCSPEDDENNPANLNGLVPASLDGTIKQIMRVMNNCNFNYTKIINLSDIRIVGPNQDKFFKMLDNELQCVDHSIFSENNREHVRDFLNPDSLFFLAWGVDERLKDLAEQALKVLHQFWGANIIKTGWKNKKNNFGYKHPNQWKEVDKIEWVYKV